MHTTPKSTIKVSLRPHLHTTDAGGVEAVTPEGVFRMSPEDGTKLIFGGEVLRSSCGAAAIKSRVFYLGIGSGRYWASLKELQEVFAGRRYRCPLRPVVSS